MPLHKKIIRTVTKPVVKAAKKSPFGKVVRALRRK